MKRTSKKKTIYINTRNSSTTTSDHFLLARGSWVISSWKESGVCLWMGVQCSDIRTQRTTWQTSSLRLTTLSSVHKENLVIHPNHYSSLGRMMGHESIRKCCSLILWCPWAMGWSSTGWSVGSAENLAAGRLRSVQVLYNPVLPNSGPHPLNKQNKHGLRPPP